MRQLRHEASRLLLLLLLPVLAPCEGEHDAAKEDEAEHGEKKKGDAEEKAVNGCGHGGNSVRITLVRTGVRARVVTFEGKERLGSAVE